MICGDSLIAVTMNSNDTVRILKRAVMEQSSIRLNHLTRELLTVSFRGKMWADEATLADAGIGSEALVDVQSGML